MKEKDIRIDQLEELKSGIFSGTYYTEVKHFDGRIIARHKFSTKEECIKAYNRHVKEFSGYATVKRYVQFDF